MKKKKHICCDGECNHDDCCGKIKENCPNYGKPITGKGWAIINQIDLPKCKAGTILSIHLEKPVTTLSIFEVKEIEYKIK
jgi:hypothetical protein